MVEEDGSVCVIPAVVVKVWVVRMVMVCIICVSGEGVNWALGDGGDYFSFQRLLCREGGRRDVFSSHVNSGYVCTPVAVSPHNQLAITPPPQILSLNHFFFFIGKAWKRPVISYCREKFVTHCCPPPPPPPPHNA